MIFKGVMSVTTKNTKKDEKFNSSCQKYSIVCLYTSGALENSLLYLICGKSIQ